jgi:o-succinylbenzoate---CoA ligase
VDRTQLNALIRATGCAEEHAGTFFLRDPHGPPVPKTIPLSGSRENSLGWLCLPTGGTSGGVRYARHDEATLTAAAGGFSEFFGLPRVNAVGVLPAYHVSGFMARVRCAATGGEHLAWDWKRLEAGETPVLPDGGPWVISLVPTQLQRLLGSRAIVAWLRRLAVIFLGGGPSWPELTDAAAREGLRLSLSYGMTETAAMVTALRPEEFLAGARSSGGPLPHARVTVDAEGAIGIAGESVFRGYWPEWRAEREFRTQDAGQIDARGHLHVLGRRDAVIITGGKKVQPLEVEAALRASGEFADVAVVGVPDAEWGEAVVACYPKSGRAPDVVKAAAGLPGPLRPKRWIAIDEWPRNAQGKINRAVLLAKARRRD